MIRTEFDVIIIGGGPAGSSAAILLARAGWSVGLVEKQRFPRRKVCGECIAASNLPLLDALGVGAAIDAAAGPKLHRVALMNREDCVVAALPAANHSRHRWGRALGRETLDTVLITQARAVGAHVMQPWSVQAIQGATGSWHAAIRSIESDDTLTLHAPVLIDAHGSWEAIRSVQPGQRRVHRAADLFAFKANFHDATLREGLLPVLMFDGGYGGMVLADQGLTTLACCVRRDRLDLWRSESSTKRVGDIVEARLRRELGGVRRTLLPATRVGAWLAAGPIDPGIRLRPEDGAFRIGNAAGEAHPIIGEGMSMALQSAWLLCGHLVANRPRDAAWQRWVAATYCAQWRRQFAPRLRLANAFAQLAMRPGWSTLLMAAGRRWPELMTSGGRWSGKVRCAADQALIAQLNFDAIAKDMT